MTDQHAGNTVTVSHPIASARKYFTIGQLAREFGLTLRTLRFDQDRGLDLRRVKAQRGFIRTGIGRGWR